MNIHASLQGLEDPANEIETRYSPIDGQTVTWSGRWASQHEVTKAVSLSQEAFPAWSRTTLEHRVECVQKFAMFLQAHRPEIAKSISLESGKPLWESDLEVSSAVAKVDLAIDALRKRRWNTHERIGAAQSSVRFRPLGPMVVLGPYNLPLHLPGAHIVPALLAGNTILFKPSEKSPAVGHWILRAWSACDLPHGVIQLVDGAVPQAKWLVGSPGIAGVLFTGSYAAGRQIHQQLAGRPECMLALEMGGNNPLVVDRVKNRKAAIATIVQSAFITSGQRCTCARRLIVVKHSENAGLMEELSRAIGRIHVGNPIAERQPFMGTLVSESAAQSILSAQEQWRLRGGAVLQESRVIGDCPAMLSPGLIHAATPIDDDQEHFGPLLLAMEVSDLDEAIALSHRTGYGLAAGLLSDDPSAYFHFVKEVRSGIINWNSPTTGASGKLPFGGIGFSGNHRPSGYFAADYCSYPVASIENHELSNPESLPPGLQELLGT